MLLSKKQMTTLRNVNNTVSTPMAVVLSMTEENGKAIGSLASKAASQFTALGRKVEDVGRRNPDVLERKIEELSGQLVSLAQHSRQQQELLDKIWSTRA